MDQNLLIILIVILSLIVTGLAIAIFIIFRKMNGTTALDQNQANSASQELQSSISLVMQHISELGRTFDNKISGMERAVGDKLSYSTKEMNETMRHQTSESFKVLRDVTERLTKLDETNKQVVSFTDQLQSLQDILKNPKQRGILGEYYLETLLKNVLPPGGFEMQYRLGQNEDGVDLVPDAVVKIRDKFVPIDSKFSLENYNRIIEERDPVEKEKLEKLFVSNLKDRITETSKYIKPGLGTVDFAFMFIPHEAIYYDLLINKIGVLKEDSESLIQRAASKYHVIIVSPTSFLAYLQTVLQGLKALQIEEQAKDIVKRVGELTLHLKKYAEHQDKLGRSLSTVVNQYNDSTREFKKIDKDIMRLTDKEQSLEYEMQLIDKPGESDDL